MLGVTFGKDLADLKAPKAKKAKKEKHKHKKDKKSYKTSKSTARKGSSEDSGDSSADEGGAAPAEVAGDGATAAPVVREGWMTKPSRIMEATPLLPTKEQEEAAKEPEITIGLKIMKAPNEAAAGAAPARAGPVPHALAGDGGASWRLKALKRARDQAQSEGKDLNSVVTERWGSLTSLTASLSTGRAADSRAHLTAASHRQRSEARSQDRAAHNASQLRDGEDGQADDRADGDRPGRAGGGRGGHQSTDTSGEPASFRQPGGRQLDRGEFDRDAGGRGGGRHEREREAGGSGRDGRSREEGAPAAAALPHYLRDVGSDKSKMRRPSAADDDSLSWRRKRDAKTDPKLDSGLPRRESEAAAATATAAATNGDMAEQEGVSGSGKSQGADASGATQVAGTAVVATTVSGRHEKIQWAPKGDHAAGASQADRSREAAPASSSGRKEEAEGDGRQEDRRGDATRQRERRSDDRASRGNGDSNRGRDQDAQDVEGGAHASKRERDSNDRRPDDSRGSRRPDDVDGHRSGGRGRESSAWREDERRSGVGGRHDSRQPHQRGQNAEQMEALRAVASSLNTFSDDGSFLERFAAQKQKQQQPIPAQGAEGNDVGGPRRGQTVPEDEIDAQNQESGNGRHDHQAPTTGGATHLRPPEDAPGASAHAETSATAGVAPPAAANRSIAALMRARLAGGSNAADIAAAVAVKQAAAAAEAARVAAAAPRPPPSELASQQRTRRSGRDNRSVGADGDGDAGGAAILQRGGRRGGGRDEATRGPRLGEEQFSSPSSSGDDKGMGGDDSSGGDSSDNGGDGSSGGPRKRRKEVVHMPLVDARGRAAPGAFGRDAAGVGGALGSGRRVGKKQVQRYNGAGEKERYFADDDVADLDTLVRRAKYGDDEDADMDSAVAGNIMAKKRFKANDLDVDAEYDYDGGIEMYEKRSKRGGQEAQKARDRSRQISHHARSTKAEDNCTYCASSSRRPKHLVISLGLSTYLMLPPKGRLVPGHCIITCADHIASLRQVDDSVWTEVKNFQKCLIRMYGAEGRQVIFMETALDVKGHRHHAIMEAIPVSDKVLERAKGYFKKGLQEAESEWSTHAAKAVIDTTNVKGLRESVPVNFPYFYVQFGYGAGYVHVVDDETKFDANFGRQILAGLLQLGAEVMHQRARAESAATQAQWVAQFRKQWDPVDWTKALL